MIHTSQVEMSNIMNIKDFKKIENKKINIEMPM